MRIRKRTAHTLTIATSAGVIAVALCACSPGNTNTSSAAPVNVAATGSEAGNAGGGSPQASSSAGSGGPAASGSPAASAASASASPAASASASPTPESSNAPSASGGGQSQSGPFDFELAQGFTGFSPDDQVAAVEEENAFKHVLFEIDPGGTSYVIDGNLSPTPVEASVTPGSDGSLNIAYDEQVGGAASTSIQFDGVLSSNGTMNARAVVDQAGGTVADGAEYLGASTGSYEFTGVADKVSPGDVPNPPTGGGQCGWTSDYGIWLTWGAPSQGPAPSGYDIYEFVAEVNPPLFYLGRVTTAGVTDNSGTTRENDASIISYTVYSVGPTGLDSPTGTTITVDGVMPGSPPSCTVS
jgi:hypothetical protein